MRYIEVLSDPQGLRLLSKRPCQHSSCSWAKASKPMKIKAARIHPATTFFTMTATPRGLAHYATTAKMMIAMAAAVNAPEDRSSPVDLTEIKRLSRFLARSDENPYPTIRRRLG
jgi:hypothetical protein